VNVGVVWEGTGVAGATGINARPCAPPILGVRSTSCIRVENCVPRNSAEFSPYLCLSAKNFLIKKNRFLTEKTIIGQHFIFVKNSEFSSNLQFLTKNPIFDKELRFLQKLRFWTKTSIFDKKTSIFDKNIDFWQKPRFLTKKLPILDKNFDFWQKTSSFNQKRFLFNSSSFGK